MSVVPDREMVTMRHPDVEQTATASVAAYERVWAGKGWVAVDEASGDAEPKRGARGRRNADAEG